MTREENFLKDWLFADLDDLIDCDFSSAPSEREEEKEKGENR